MATATLAPTETIRILLLEDNPSDADLCIRKLKSSGLRVEVDLARSSRDFMQLARSRRHDVVLADYRLPDWNGMDAFQWLRGSGHPTPFVLLTGTLGDEVAIECIKAGVNDYVLKENLERLPVAVRRALEEQKLRQARDQADKEIREGKEQLQLLLDSTAEAIYAIDRKGACTLCNAACLRLLGYTHDSELLGKNMHAVMHHTRPDGSPYPVEECGIYRSFRQGKESHVTEEVLWRRNGTSFPAEYWSYPIKHDERIVGSVATFVDITERKKAEEQLRRSESRYRSIIDSAPYGIFRVDQSGRIVMANPALATMLGYETAQEVLALNTGKDVYLSPEDQQRARDYASEDPVVGHETKWKRKDGKTITVRLGGRRLPDDEELPGGFEVFVEDITEQRSLQKQFEHAQKMEAVGRLAGGVAHDFNNLLMVISGYAQLMEELRTDNPKVSQYVTQIREASSRAANITRQLLAFSRKQVLEPTLLDLNHVVKDLCKMLARLLGEDIEIVTKLDPHLGTIRADRGQLEQVIMNLAVNARDAMPKGGRLILETTNVVLDIAYHQRREISVPPGRYVLLSLSDTGTGMDSETLLHSFEPFFSTKEEGKGTGLGLATVYGIVKQSQGFIWVYSELGKGSMFKIYLPRLDGAATGPSSASVQATPGGTETILLTEDDAAVRNVSRFYLESKGYTVLEASNANEALDFCNGYQKPIHVLITDMVMPGMTGFELAKAVLELRPGLAVVLVSGYTDRALDTDASSIGARFLQKPFSLDALARAVRLLVSRNRRILLIEDSQFMRIAIDRMLTVAGYSVKTASDGDEGLQMVREIRPDLVLLDMMLPKTPGLAVLRAIRKNPATANIPVIVITVLSERNKKRALAEGASAYVEKSEKLLANDAALLVEAIGNALGYAASQGRESCGREKQIDQD